MVIAGDNKGEKGNVLKVFPEDYRAIVEGVNLVKKHMKPTAQNTGGSIIEKEAPIHMSNLMLIDGSGNPTRIRRAKDEEGKSVRVSVKSGEVIK